ncbi:MAG: hypothetical protein RL693_1004 [Verrucomicrobiota bacterium]|jgi:hypothetical protein
MKPTSDTQPIFAEPDELNEIEREGGPEETEEGMVMLAPEESSGTAEVTVWDEPPDAVTKRVPVMPLQSDETIVEELVNAGNEEADLELREAAAEDGEE